MPYPVVELFWGEILQEDVSVRGSVCVYNSSCVHTCPCVLNSTISAPES